LKLNADIFNQLNDCHKSSKILKLIRCGISNTFCFNYDWPYLCNWFFLVKWLNPKTTVFL